MAILHPLLEQFVAGPGAGQKQLEALEAETLGSEISFAPGSPKEEGSAEGTGSVGLDLGRPPLTCPLLGVRKKQSQEGKVSHPQAEAELCLETQEGGMWLPPGSPPGCTFLCTGTKLRNSSTWPTDSQSE